MLPTIPIPFINIRMVSNFRPENFDHIRDHHIGLTAILQNHFHLREYVQ